MTINEGREVAADGLWAGIDTSSPLTEATVRLVRWPNPGGQCELRQRVRYVAILSVHRVKIAQGCGVRGVARRFLRPARVAPVAATRVWPVWRKSWKRKSAMPTFAGSADPARQRIGWAGAGSNRRPSAFQEDTPGGLVPARRPLHRSSCDRRAAAKSILALSWKSPRGRSLVRSNRQ